MSTTDSSHKFPSIVSIAAGVLRDELRGLPAAGTPMARSASTPGAAHAQPFVARSGTTAPDRVVLLASYSVEPGDVAYVSYAIEPDAQPTAGCAVHATDLLGPSGHRIPVSHVRTTVRLGSSAPSTPGHVHVEIRVPTGCPSAWYTGYLQADDQSWQALLKIGVGRSLS